MNERLVADVKSKTCVRHSDTQRPCPLCYERAETQRDSKQRAESRRLHAEYLQRVAHVFLA